MATRNLAARIAARHLEAEWHLTAKPKYLKAIDFTMGLMRRLQALGLQLPGTDTQEVLRRLVEMRKRTQGGFRLDTLFENKAKLQSRGAEVLAAAERKEAALLPSEKDFAAFVRDFPNKMQQQSMRQSSKLEAIIADSLAVPTASVRGRIMTDQNFMMRAYASVTPALASFYAKISAGVGANAQGRFEHRLKHAKSVWGKQSRSNTPFTELYDLIGVRIVAPTVRDMAQAAAAMQNSYSLVQKKNYYLENKGYNAINYVLSHDWLMFEFQLKTDINAIEASISHDLIYAEEKAIYKLTTEEKALVSLVIDVSTQLSMNEWAEFINTPMAMG